MKLYIFSLILLAFTVQAQQILQDRPIIGILMQESNQAGYPPSEYSYIAASYVKYVEMAGARVVPLYYDAPYSYYDSMLKQLNGVLIPGGAAEFDESTKLGKTSQYILQQAMIINDEGTFFPVWGTCNGFEILATIIADFEQVLTHIDLEEGINHKLDIQLDGDIFTYMPEEIKTNIETEKLSFFNHEWALTTKTWNKTQKLRDFFKLLATAKNPLGEEFVAVIEGVKYPFYGVQFHPEKSVYEWKVDANHSLHAVEQAQYYADFFVQQSRRNSHTFESQTEEDAVLIYNYSPISIPSSSFEQVYIFRNYPQPQVEQQQQIQKTSSLFEKIKQKFKKIKI